MPICNALAVIRNYRPFPPTITSSDVVIGRINTSGFYYLTTATNSPTSFRISALPAGLKYNTTTGELTGTPTTINVNGTVVTLSASNIAGTGTKPLRIRVLPHPPVITSILSAVGYTGVSFNYQIVATNMLPSYLPLYDAIGLPPDLVVSPGTGEITGIPNDIGTSFVPICAANAGGSDGEILQIEIRKGPPVITQPDDVTQAVDTYFEYYIEATNEPTLYSATGLPGGLQINTDTGHIWGQIDHYTSNKTFTITIRASNEAGAATPRTFKFNIVALPKITIDPISVIDTDYGTSTRTVVTNGPITSWSLKENLIPIQLQPASISNQGVVTVFASDPDGGTYILEGTAYNLAGSVDFSVTVNIEKKLPYTPPTFTSGLITSNILTLKVGVSYSHTWQGQGSKILTFDWAGAVPNGMSFTQIDLPATGSGSNIIYHKKCTLSGTPRDNIWSHGQSLYLSDGSNTVEDHFSFSVGI